MCHYGAGTMKELVTPKTDVARSNNFGSLRIIFAAMVIVSHSPELIDGNRSREILTMIFGTLSLGEVAVDGFFLMSGYLIIKSYQNATSVRDYLAKRVIRIYPGFAVAYLLSLVVVTALAGGNPLLIEIPKSLVRLLLLKDPTAPGIFQGLPYPALNGSMWSIAHEFRCYLLVIAIGYFVNPSKRIGYGAILLGLTMIYILRNRIPETSVWPSFLIGRPADVIRMTFIFFVGGAFYVWRDRITYTHRGALVSATILVCLMFVQPVAEVALSVFGGYLIFWFAFVYPVNRVSRAMDHNDPSYGLYLYAWPIQNLLVFYVAGIGPWTVTAVALPTALIFGLLSWRLIEKPALRHKGMLAGTRTRAVHAVS